MQIRLILPLALLLAGPFVLSSAGAGAEPAPEPTPLAFETNLAGSRLELLGPGRIRGVAPLEVPGPVTGEFWLEADGPRVEPQRGRVRIGFDGDGSQIVSYGRPSFRERLLGGLLFPGYAQLRVRERSKAILLGAAATATVALSVWSQLELNDAQESVDAAALAASDMAVGDSERRAREETLRDVVEEEQFASRRRNLYLAACAATWGVGLVDAVLFAPEFRVRRANESTLALSLERRSRLRASLRSLAFPGLGQHYNGENRKALAAAAGGVAALGYLLHEQNEHNAAARSLTQAELRLANAGTPEEAESLRMEVEGAQNDLDRQSRDRKVALGVTAGVWGLALLDTLLSPPGGSPGSLSFAPDPGAGTLAAYVRF
jgi:hypothetical protein